MLEARMPELKPTAMSCLAREVYNIGRSVWEHRFSFDGDVRRTRTPEKCKASACQGEKRASA